MERLRRGARWALSQLRGDEPAQQDAAAAEAAERSAAAQRACAYARVTANLVLWAAQLALTDLNALTGTGAGIGGAYAAGGALATLVQPAAYAFGVWVLLYTGMIAYVLWQAAPSNWQAPLARRTGWWTALSFALLGVWGAVASAAPNPATVAVQAPLLLVMLLLLRCLQIAVTAALWHHEQLTTAEQWCVAAPLSALAGWITLASLLNAAALALVLGASWLAYDAANVVPAAFCLAAVGLLGCVLAFTSGGNPVLVGTYVWGLLGVVVANARPGYAALAVVAGVDVGVVLAALLYAMCTVPGDAKWGVAFGARVKERVAVCCGDCCFSLGTFCGRACTCWCCQDGGLEAQEDVPLLGTAKRRGVWAWLMPTREDGESRA